MAGACRASLSFPSPPPVTTVTTTSGGGYRPKRVSASFSVPSKAHQRKNYLRPKILKTLTKPLPTPPLPEIPPAELVLPVATPPRFLPVNDGPSGEATSEVFPTGGKDDVESFQMLATVSDAGEFGGVTGKISVNFVLKFAVYVLGFFVLETAVVLLLFRTSEKEDRLRSSDERKNALVSGNGQLGSGFGNAGYSNESELEEKINEIRAMAREARESEKRQLPEGDEEIGIEKEVSARLVKLQKKLASKKDKLPGSLINSLGLFDSAEGDLDDSDEAGNDEPVPLMIKKKHRFRSPSVKTMSAPKGFSGSKDSKGSVKGNLNGASRNSGIGSTKKEKGTKAGSSQASSMRNDGNVAPEEWNLGKETESGAVQEGGEEISGVETTNSQKEGSSRVTKNKQQSNKNSSSVGSLSQGDRERPVRNNVKGKKSDLETDVWWSKLPYVLAILMRQGTEHEREEGFFIVQLASATADKDNSYTLAFQDRSDAKNFRFLLESFFEKLDDFSADIVPLPVMEIMEETMELVQELQDAMKSESKKVLVVRKGQLKLYAGQPFEEVEMALRSLIEQNQSM